MVVVHPINNMMLAARNEKEADAYIPLLLRRIRGLSSQFGRSEIPQEGETNEAGGSPVECVRGGRDDDDDEE